MSDDVEQKIGYIGSRLREKSTYAGLAVLIGIFLPWLMSKFPELSGTSADTIATAVSSIGIGIGTLICIFLPEKGSKAVIAFLLMPLGAVLLLAGAPAARAGDIASPAVNAINKALAAGYPTKCGAYYGLGTGGNAGAVNGAAAGTQIVQGDLDILVGYTCPFAGNAFWFGEASFGFANLNGNSNGLALSGPLVAIERVGVGSPIQALLGNLLPNLNFPAMPSTPSFPNGVTPTTAPASYMFAGMVEQDIGAQIGALSGHQWVVAPMIGVGLLTRYSNNMMVDTWAGWQMNSNSFCPGGGASCAKLGNMARIGVSLKY